MRRIIIFLLALPVFAWADTPAESAWLVETIDDSMAPGSKIVALVQDSAKTIKDEAASNDVTPRLEIRCAPGGASVTARIDWKRFISSFSTEVGFKVDGGRFTWLKWKVDSSEQVTISPSTDDSQKLIDILKNGDELLVEVSPYSRGPETAAFDLDGFSAALDALLSKCQ